MAVQVQVELVICVGNSRDSTALPRGKQALLSRSRTSVQAAAATRSPLRHTQAQAAVPPSHPVPLSSDSESGSMNVDLVQSTVDGSQRMPSDSFPGFALLAKAGAVTAGDIGASDSHDRNSGRSAEPLLFPPVPSQEAVLKPPTSSGDTSLTLLECSSML